jgi:two-component system sensor histidine kinase KdpD
MSRFAFTQGASMTRSWTSDAWRLGASLASVAVVTWACLGWLKVSNAATISTTFLLIVLVVAATSRLRVAVATSVAAMLTFNFFFLPPVGTLTIADPQNWVALFAFLAVSLVASNLSAVARERTREAVSRRDELARLFDLGRDVLVMSDSRDAIAMLARSVARRFDLEFVAIALPHGAEWEVCDAGARTVALDAHALTRTFAASQASLEFDANARAYTGHAGITVDGRAVRLVPLRVGTRPIGLLAASGRPIEAGTLDALAGVVAIAIERAHFLEERRTGALTKQREELKTALLASLGHDLRTPLAAIRIAASNVKSPEVTAEERLDQADLILAEVERLTRLFENVHEMARIDAGGIENDARWVHPSEIVAAARDQVEYTLQGHRVEVAIERDVPVRLDPRLTAAATAHLIENAAQYTPQGSRITITARQVDEGLAIEVEDEGPGVAATDLPHLFERFYRGATAKSRASGTGMGLWIARGLLAAQRGRIWAENGPSGGARFTLVVPALVRDAGDPPEASS